MKEEKEKEKFKWIFITESQQMIPETNFQKQMLVEMWLKGLVKIHAVCFAKNKKEVMDLVQKLAESRFRQVHRIGFRQCYPHQKVASREVSHFYKQLLIKFFSCSCSRRMLGKKVVKKMWLKNIIYVGYVQLMCAQNLRFLGRKGRKGVILGLFSDFRPILSLFSVCFILV